MGLGSTLGRAGAGWATGGLSEVYRMLNQKDETSQVPMMTPWQIAGQNKLLEFMNTGKFNDFTAGEKVPLGYGDFTATQEEQQGLSTLQKILRNGMPDQYRMGDEALKGFLTTNPDEINAQFQPFKDQVDRSINESDASLKRSAGVTGSLYSTDTVRGLGDIRARGNETLTSKLVDLTNEALNRRLAAVPLAYQSGAAQQESELQRVGASQRYGSLIRQLNDASIKARDAELLRRRQELQLPIAAAGQLANASATFGVPSVKSSPYQELLGLIGQVGGTALGTYIGSPAGGAIGGKLGGIATA